LGENEGQPVVPGADEPVEPAVPDASPTEAAPAEAATPVAEPPAEEFIPPRPPEPEIAPEMAAPAERIVPPAEVAAMPEAAPEEVVAPVADGPTTAFEETTVEGADGPTTTLEESTGEEGVPAEVAALGAELQAEDDIEALKADLEAETTETADGAESLSDIPPAAAATAATAALAADIAEPQAGPPGIPWWPFLAYLGLWVVLIGVAVWQFLQVPPGHPVYETVVYSYTVLGGLIMTAVGPMLIAAVWLASWLDRPKGERSGLLSSALIKGATATLGGVLLWWVALMLVDYLRLGRTL
jgi:hypothetical protein